MIDSDQHTVNMDAKPSTVGDAAPLSLKKGLADGTQQSKHENIAVALGREREKRGFYSVIRDMTVFLILGSRLVSAVRALAGYDDNYGYIKDVVELVMLMVYFMAVYFSGAVS